MARMEGIDSPAIEQDPSIAQIQAQQLGQQQQLAVSLPATGFVASFNGLSGILTLSGGTNISITSDGVSTITVSVTGLQAMATVKCNFTAIVPPTVADDAFNGYAVGSLWVDTVGANAYICVNPSTGSAIWKIIT